MKARYVGVCRGCGAYTQPRNGKGDAYAYCKACHPGAIQRRWTRERVLDAMREWVDRYGRLPSAYDWSRTHARQRGGEALARLDGRGWPPASVVTSVFGTWGAARAATGEALPDTRSLRLPREAEDLAAGSEGAWCDHPGNGGQAQLRNGRALRKARLLLRPLANL
ncbi:MAG: hypothetical protein ACLP0L_03590 [Solirubrobacteraceae bacterium]